jgi:hypothetical protein
MIRTGEQYIESIRDGREVYFGQSPLWNGPLDFVQKAAGLSSNVKPQ